MEYIQRAEINGKLYGLVPEDTGIYVKTPLTEYGDGEIVPIQPAPSRFEITSRVDSVFYSADIAIAESDSLIKLYSGWQDENPFQSGLREWFALPFRFSCIMQPENPKMTFTHSRTGETYQVPIQYKVGISGVDMGLFILPDFSGLPQLTGGDYLLCNFKLRANLMKYPSEYFGYVCLL